LTFLDVFLGDLFGVFLDTFLDTFLGDLFGVFLDDLFGDLLDIFLGDFFGDLCLLPDFLLDHLLDRLSFLENLFIYSIKKYIKNIIHVKFRIAVEIL
jgi:hypothetical protein